MNSGKAARQVCSLEPAVDSFVTSFSLSHPCSWDILFVGTLNFFGRLLVLLGGNWNAVVAFCGFDENIFFFWCILSQSYLQLLPTIAAHQSQQGTLFKIQLPMLSRLRDSDLLGWMKPEICILKYYRWKESVFPSAHSKFVTSQVTVILHSLYGQDSIYLLQKFLAFFLTFLPSSALLSLKSNSFMAFKEGRWGLLIETWFPGVSSVKPSFPPPALLCPTIS